LSSSSPQLSFKKWSFPDQNQVFDFAPAGKYFFLSRIIYSIPLIGLITDNRFDQFCVASMTGGYQAQVLKFFLNLILIKFVLFRFVLSHHYLLV
jgi:hypothetical protein